MDSIFRLPKQKPKYAALSMNEKGSLDESTARFDDIQQSRRPRASRILISCAVLGMLSGLISTTILINQAYGHKHQQHSRLLSARTLVPEIPFVVQMWEEDERFTDVSKKADKFWDEMMPIGNGYIKVENPRRYDIPNGRPVHDDSAEAEVYALSVTHQLHCLAMIRQAIVASETNATSSSNMGHHIHHCIDYIRKGILCAGDTSLEWSTAIRHGNHTRYITSGDGSQHQCRDWTVLKAFMESQRATDAHSAIHA
ncbi:hypothetical protein LTR91_012797 [Friedmanniomyces endolithicus]|uniref:Oxidase ustYa n=1 Tax=Friedmanniomyces endolithicus TaxID=329885 RepID=A0AAN6KF42_9PEZI|nr:hypothetical protein LTR38_007466 [Friedmanniomyces endolithicus]KAK0800752.1 hypothetical protein LTR59_005657 [Friedmanniomyces endolithicus]KAK0815822.1 hypothetical protein LTR75_003773 [Friedmanniomyces endolithicus]KAK0849832.1 hypothetical protein LTR03_005018 [Friedmanniomyces endolithicus]KAK0865000.1 hypothetical protein LTS02_005643 [Friedmanniomyces endolithicus]